MSDVIFYEIDLPFDLKTTKFYIATPIANIILEKAKPLLKDDDNDIIAEIVWGDRINNIWFEMHSIPILISNKKKDRSLYDACECFYLHDKIVGINLYTIKITK